MTILIKISDIRYKSISTQEFLATIVLPVKYLLETKRYYGMILKTSLELFPLN